MKELTIEELRKYEVIFIEDFSNYRHDKCWNGGCYSYTDKYVRREDNSGIWDARYSSSCEMKETEFDVVEEEDLLKCVNEQVRHANGEMPEYLSHCYVSVVEKDPNTLVCTMCRKGE